MGENEIQFSLKRKDGRRRQWKWIGHVMNNNNNNNIFSLINRLTNALCCTFTCYAIETILTTSRTDSLQYTALIAAYKAYPPYGARTRYLSLSTPDVIQSAIAPLPRYMHYTDIRTYIRTCIHGHRLYFYY